MKYPTNIKGKYPKKTPPNGEAEKGMVFVNKIVEISNLKQEVLDVTSQKMKEIDTVLANTVDSATNKIDKAIKKLDGVVATAEGLVADSANKIIDHVKSLEYIKGDPGLNADENSIFNKLLSKVPTEESLLAKAPKFNEEEMLNRFITKIPENKASLKVIQERFEVDPMSVIEKIMALPEDMRKKLKFKVDNIDGLDQTIKAFSNQLSRGYLHGSGISNITGLIQAGTNITITGAGTAASPYIINGNSGGVVSVSGNSPIVIDNTDPVNPIVTIQQSGAGQDGYLSSTDWNTFNNKQNSLSFGDLTDVGTDGITITGGTGAVIGTGTSIDQHVADASNNGYLSSTDWNTFNSKLSSVSLTATQIAFGSGSNLISSSADLTYNNALLVQSQNTGGATLNLHNIGDGVNTNALLVNLYAAVGNNPDYLTSYYYTTMDGSSVSDGRLTFGTEGIDTLNLKYGRVGVGSIQTPTAYLHLPAVTTGGNTAPLKLTLGGTLMTAPEAGAVEAINTHIYWTDSAGTRWQLDQQSGTPLLLQTNGTPNGDQTILNLIGGTNITLVDNGVGGVTINAAGAAVPTQITVANESTDTSCSIAFFTAATGDLGPKTNANLTFNSNTGVLTLGQTASASITGNAGTATALQNARTIGGVSFDGTANITVASATGGFAVSGGNLTMSTNKITGLGDPSADQDAATKAYVDNVAQGLNVKASVLLGTAAALPTNTYSNGASGVGATLTGTVNGALTVDGVVVTVADRILVKNEVATANNGIYIVTTVGTVGTVYVLTRALDMNTSTEFPGTFTFVEAGTANSDTGWVCTTNPPVTVGSTSIVFVQFSGAGSYTAGNGLTLTGTQFSINTSITADLSSVQTFTNKLISGGQITSAVANATLAATATALANSRTIGGVSFDGTANITVATATGGFTVSGGDLALGANNITMTGSIGTTGSRITKLWATDITVTNAIAGSITGNAATATALQNARTIGGTSFDGTANITVATATGGFTVSGGALALGANNLTMTGSLAATGARVTKGWFTDIESTNMPTVGGTAILSSLTAPSFTTVELGSGGATDTTLSRISAGVLGVEGVRVITSASTTSGTILQNNGTTFVASTATFPTAATSGKIFIGDGTNIVLSTPTFPNASATSGKIIKSDGTNWVASTETYATPGTSGNVLTSDGTNWTSAAATSGANTSLSNLVANDVAMATTVSLTATDIKALHTTPITLVGAPGAGKLIVVEHVLWSFTVGTQYANGDNLRVQYNGDTTTLVAALSNGVIDAASSSTNLRWAGATAGNTAVTTTAGTNKAVEVGLISATAFITGTGTLKAFVKYRIITL